jgi:hypothetical protein
VSCSTNEDPKKLFDFPVLKMPPKEPQSDIDSGEENDGNN